MKKVKKNRILEIVERLEEDDMKQMFPQGAMLTTSGRCSLLAEIKELCSSGEESLWVKDP